MNKDSYVFTSESVCDGHPDKLCDAISDALLDEYLAHDKTSKVALETLVKSNTVVVAGEVKSSHTFDYEPIIRKVITEIGYNDWLEVFNSLSCKIITLVNEQSHEINDGVVKDAEEDQGAGDQGIMFGYACKETKQLMPLPISISHEIVRRLKECREKVSFLKPDGKSQVSIVYGSNGQPQYIDTVVVSANHYETINLEELKKYVLENVVMPSVPQEMVTEKTKFFINPAGTFISGGPTCDTGLTGRKIIVDTYGGFSRIGGGAFSGKDPSKVDRSGAYFARWVAKHIVATGLSEKCEIQISYAIGKAQPTSIFIETFGTERMPISKITQAVKETFDFRPGSYIKELGLLDVKYRPSASFGHFGREEFPWEKLSPEKINKLNSYTTLSRL